MEFHNMIQDNSQSLKKVSRKYFVHCTVCQQFLEHCTLHVVLSASHPQSFSSKLLFFPLSLLTSASFPAREEDMLDLLFFKFDLRWS